jgi:hypothetical protein
MKAGRYELDVQTKGGVAPACRQCIIAALAAAIVFTSLPVLQG